MTFSHLHSLLPLFTNNANLDVWNSFFTENYTLCPCQLLSRIIAEEVTRTMFDFPRWSGVYRHQRLIYDKRIQELSL